MPKEKVRIVEVGPRDGLQNESQTIATHEKMTFIDKLAKAGLPVIEAASFVSPKWVPQMGDHMEVMGELKGRNDAIFTALVPNMKGFENALSCDVQEVAVFAAASESFSQKNINCSIAESLERFAPIFEAAKDKGIKVRAYVSCIAGCPYEGEITPAAVADVARRLTDMGAYEISLGDTIGVGTPRKIKAVLAAVEDAGISADNLALHVHDTYGQALANIYAALEEGVRVFDASAAGLGGCPYAKGATGNVATEDVVYLLEGEGFSTGVDLKKVVDAAWFISHILGIEPKSKLAHAI